ncbi:MAG: hypothetical protein ABSC50_02965 [Candidatus Bathyarchaeia archaeon]
MCHLDSRDPRKSGKGVRAAYVKVRKKVPMIRNDRALACDIEAVANMISDGTLLEAVESSIGPLK